MICTYIHCTLPFPQTFTPRKRSSKLRNCVFRLIIQFVGIRELLVDILLLRLLLLFQDVVTRKVWAKKEEEEKNKKEMAIAEKSWKRRTARILRTIVGNHFFYPSNCVLITSDEPTRSLYTCFLNVEFLLFTMAGRVISFLSFRKIG